jgi:hypothetical protein
MSEWISKSCKDAAAIAEKRGPVERVTYYASMLGTLDARCWILEKKLAEAIDLLGDPTVFQKLSGALSARRDLILMWARTQTVLQLKSSVTAAAEESSARE